MKLLLENWRKFINEEYEPITTLRIFDFDETIAHTRSETRVKAPDGTEATLRDQQEFEEYMNAAAAPILNRCPTHLHRSFSRLHCS